MPVLTTLSPSSANVGAAAQTLTINGTNFLSTSTVTYNGVAHTATFVSATQLTIPLSAADQATAGTYPVVVSNPSPGGGASNPPELHGHQPRADPHQPVALLGECGGGGADAHDQRHQLPLHLDRHLQRGSTYGDLCERHAVDDLLSAADQATAGTYPVVVTNPSPGGGASNPLNFTVTPNPVPALTSLSPSSATAGAAGQTLTIKGTTSSPPRP